jgi:predicted ArsR family transcriptional regulator
MRAELDPATDGVEGLTTAMAKQGFAPEVRRRGALANVVLETCPFTTTVLSDRETVCQMHLGMAEGLTEGTDATVEKLVAKDPRKAGCRLAVRVTPS